MSNLAVAVFFTRDTGVPATSLTLADIDLYLVAQDKSTGADTAIWVGGRHPTEEIDNVGAYTRIYDDADFDTYNYYARGSYTGATELDVDHVQGSSSGPEASEIASVVWGAEYRTIAGVAVWATADRRLTEGTVPTDAVVSGNKITVYRGTTWSIPIEGLGKIGDDDVLYFTVKTKKEDADASAKLQLRVGGADPGLIRFNGAETEREDGSIEILDSATGDVIVRVDESITADAIPRSLRVPTMHYDFKHISDGNAEVKAPGLFVIEADVTRAIT